MFLDHPDGGLNPVRIDYGVMDEPSIPAASAGLTVHGLRPLVSADTTCLVSGDIIIASSGAGLGRWRETVVELGEQIET